MIIRAKAPLRLGLAGGGTDVSPYSDEYGGCVLNATINLYAYCTIIETNTNKISFYAADRHEAVEGPVDEVFELSEPLMLHKAVYNRIMQRFGLHRPRSFRMVTYSDAPAGSGLGTSSTLVVSMIKAYAEWLSLPLGDYDMAQLAYEIEREDVGLSGGKQDQYAATFGGFNFIEFYEQGRVIVNPLRIKNWIVNELEASIVLYYTGTSRESAKIIDEQKRNVSNQHSSAVHAMHELKSDAYIMKEAILKGDMMTFAEYLGKSWKAKKKMASTVSNDHIERIYDVAIHSGAYAGKISGAGGGGFMMFVTDPIRKLEVVKSLEALGSKVIPFHFTQHGTQGWRV